MIFNRKIENELQAWRDKKERRPLILRGARQTGKTTVVRKFAGQFGNFIELNLEKEFLQEIFSEIKDIKEIIRSIEGVANQRVVPGETLLFLDEVQNSISAIKLLRYFYEEMPGLHVIATGSLLEVRMRTEGWSFPVGRVEFLYLYPVTFEEFLGILGEDILLSEIYNLSTKNPLTAVLHDRLISLLSDYMVVGGMPAAVAEYLSDGSFISVRKYHELLFSSFKEDFVKYSTGAEVKKLKLVWEKSPFEIGSRIKYSKLSGNDFTSISISRAFDVLHEAMLVERIFPTVSLKPPLVKKQKSAPKIVFLDIGLCISMLKLTKDQIKMKLLDPVYSGGIFEGLVGQELLALDFHNRNPLYLWVREEKGASSELDFLIQYGEKLLPIEIKSGSHGSLKSLHQFLFRSGTNVGIRIYDGHLSVDRHSIVLPDGHQIKYTLLSVPFYAISRVLQLADELGR